MGLMYRAEGRLDLDPDAEVQAALRLVFDTFEPGGGVSQLKVPMEEWQFVMPGFHPGYIDWDRFKANQEKLAATSRAGARRTRSAPGPRTLRSLR